MGSFKVLQLFLGSESLWTITLDWSNAINILFWELVNHEEFLFFKMILFFIVTFRVAMKLEQITLWNGQEFASSSFGTILHFVRSLLMLSDLLPIIVQEHLDPDLAESYFTSPSQLSQRV